MRILIVDDDETNRFVLQSMLKKSGHEVISACDGEEAITLFVKERPDLVLMDVMMPNVDGMQATAEIKSHVHDEYIPVIFLTALSDDQALSECVHAGGDDFLTKPYKKDLLHAKLIAHLRLRQLYQTVKSQRDELELHNERIQHEQVLAKEIYQNMVHAGCLDLPNIRYFMSSMALFNGDVLFAAKTPSGRLHIMLGDFTGHGLSAAIGAVPLSTIFYTMTAKGFSIPDIIMEMNTKLNQLLPVGIFCAACLLELDMSDYTLKVWNGGIPAAFVISKDRSSQRFELKSTHPPLGIFGPEHFKSADVVFDVEVGDRIFLCTDGITEGRSPEGEMFGNDRLVSVLQNSQEDDSIIDNVIDSIKTFTQTDEQTDDMTMIEVMVDPFLEALQDDDLDFDFLDEETQLPQKKKKKKPVTVWDMELTLDLSTLRVLDPIPLINQFVVDISCAQECKQEIFMVFSELVTNAIDHGMLGLDSSLKKVPEGFVKYYESRARKLKELKDGFLKVGLKHEPRDDGGALTIFIEDSGEGFDYPENPEVSMRENLNPSGRGIALVYHLCESVKYQGNGNQVEAVYCWSS